ncbi:8172_t:CDS:1, partial [Cetraspora pellucida]
MLIVILVIKTIWNLKADPKLATPTSKKKQFIIMNCECRMLLEELNVQERLGKKFKL